MTANIRRLVLSAFLPLFTLFVTSRVLAHDGEVHSSLNMREGVTDVSQSVFSLHMIILWICVVIGIVVFGVMFYSMFKHRKSQGAVSANFHENTTVEVIWTLIPLLILVGMAIPATKTLATIYEKAPADITVEVIGYQWKWQYRYLDPESGQEISFFSNMSTESDQINNKAEKGINYLLEVDEPLVLPVNTRVRFLITSADVIHSWWVPDLAVKKDAVPGIINEAWTNINIEGTFRGQCAELCGKDHGFMPIVVKGVSESEYNIWRTEQLASLSAEAEMAERAWPLEDLVELGEEVYGAFCAACHQVNGSGIQGAFPPITGSPVATGPIENHLDIIANGVPGTAMPAFANQLSAVDMAAVIAYERNALGNNTGDMISPADVKLITGN